MEYRLWTAANNRREWVPCESVFFFQRIVFLLFCCRTFPTLLCTNNFNSSPTFTPCLPTVIVVHTQSSTARRRTTQYMFCIDSFSIKLYVSPIECPTAISHSPVRWIQITYVIQSTVQNPQIFNLPSSIKKIKQHILTFKRLEPANVQHFLFEKWNDSSNIKRFCPIMFCEWINRLID